MIERFTSEIKSLTRLGRSKFQFPNTTAKYPVEYNLRFICVLTNKSHFEYDCFVDSNVPRSMKVGVHMHWVVHVVAIGYS